MLEAWYLQTHLYRNDLAEAETFNTYIKIPVSYGSLFVPLKTCFFFAIKIYIWANITIWLNN